MNRPEPDLIKLVDESDVRDVLSRVLAGPGAARPAHATQVRSFLKYVTACRLEWTAYRAQRDGEMVAVLYVLILPGNTAILMPPEPIAPGIDRTALRDLVRAALEQLSDRNLCYVQALAEPEASEKRELLCDCGFRLLARLVYMRRENTGAPAGARRLEASWLPYSSGQHESFARVLEATYDGSLDCPELTPLRTTDDAIASHKASGEFDPSLWEIACVDGEHVGCVLVSPLTGGSLAEIVYIGASPQWRGRGVGELLVRRAIELCARCGAREISVAVDQRNTPARQLYARFGFSPAGERDAYIRVDTSGARHAAR